MCVCVMCMCVCVLCVYMCVCAVVVCVVCACVCVVISVYRRDLGPNQLADAKRYFSGHLSNIPIRSASVCI